MLTGTLPTRDGSAIRDFIHVWDLADAHVRRCTGSTRSCPSGRLVLRGDQPRHRAGTTVREFVPRSGRRPDVQLRIREDPVETADDLVGSFTRQRPSQRHARLDPDAVLTGRHPARDAWAAVRLD